MEQDVIKHLIDIEKIAMNLLSGAQTEADEKISLAKIQVAQEYKKLYDTFIEKKEQEYTTQRHLCDENQEKEFQAYDTYLLSLSKNQDTFNTFLDSYFFKD